MTIITATTAGQYAAAAKLFTDYQQFLGIDLAFQGFEDELKQLPDMYGAPNGALLLAEDNGQYIGCVAVRTKGEGVCEMKRLYVTDAAKGKGAGRKLAVAIVEIAAKMGFKKMLLDTLERLTPALQLYQSLGFVEINAYYHNPLESVIYMEKQLAS